MKITYNDTGSEELGNLVAGVVFTYKDKVFMVTDETADENEDILVVCLESGIIQRYGPKLKVKPKINVELVVD
ncbi:hypothetical protein [Klebsiella phage 05F01]|nr:hypothetical protein [Klebsiella phage 05F01]